MHSCILGAVKWPSRPPMGTNRTGSRTHPTSVAASQPPNAQSRPPGFDACRFSIVGRTCSIPIMSRLSTLRAARHAGRPLQPLAMYVAIATFGVGLMYAFVLPHLSELAATVGREPPALTQLALSAGRSWLIGAITLAAIASWLGRARASVNQRVAARIALQLILVGDALLVSVFLVGFYAVIIDIPQGYG